MRRVRWPAHLALTRNELLGRDRSRDVALPRQVAMYLMREEANISLPQIGEALGGRRPHHRDVRL